MKNVEWGILPVSGIFMERVFVALRDSRILRVKAIASRSFEKAKDAARIAGIPKAYGSYEELLNDKEIDAVYISLPNSLHAVWIKKAIASGKNVLCEKPFTVNAEEAGECVELARKKGVLVMESLMYRFHPQWRRAVEVVKDGEIGRIQNISVCFFYDNKDPNNIRNSLALGGGALMDIGCYAISCARLLMDREPKRVVSISTRDSQFGVDCLFSALLDFEGARCLFTVGTQANFVQTVEVIGTKGNIVFEVPFNQSPDLPCHISVTRGEKTERIEFEPSNQYGLIFEAFSRAIAEGRETPIPSVDAIKNMKVIDALFRSEASGNWENS